jgi:hypothetical protein
MTLIKKIKKDTHFQEPHSCPHSGIYQNFRDAQAAPVKMSEFKGKVAAVLTENFRDHKLATARDNKERTSEEEIAKDTSNQGFHYYGAAKFFAPVGKSLAEALHNLT